MTKKIGERIENLMTPLENVVKARRGERLADVIEKIGTSKHSKLPVLDGDEVIGIIHSVDIQEVIARMLKESA